MYADGLILLGHGARDPRWSEPMERMKERVSRALPDDRVELAFLEIMQPDLSTAAQRLIDGGSRRIVVVPVFLGQGGHVRRDVADSIDALHSKHPHVAIVCAVAAGEDDAVLDALSAYCVKAFRTV